MPIAFRIGAGRLPVLGLQRVASSQDSQLESTCPQARQSHGQHAGTQLRLVQGMLAAQHMEALVQAQRMGIVAGLFGQFGGQLIERDQQVLAASLLAALQALCKLPDDF